MEENMADMRRALTSGLSQRGGGQLIVLADQIADDRAVASPIAGALISPRLTAESNASSGIEGGLSGSLGNVFASKSTENDVTQSGESGESPLLSKSFMLLPRTVSLGSEKGGSGGYSRSRTRSGIPRSGRTSQIGRDMADEDSI
jgi:hypothetical protein